DGAKYQRLAVQLDESLYRGEVVELEWDGRRALNENGFLAPGDRVLLTLSRDGNIRTYTISEIVRLPSLWPFVALLALALVAVARSVARITGLGTEDAIVVFVGTAGKVDMPRLVLAGVVVGSLGALVDMAVGQASTAFELSATSELRGRKLYLSALNVGRDHIGSLVNTLALAYFGGALPLIVLISLGF